MFNKKKPVLALIAASLISAAAVTAQAETVVVAGRSTAVEQITVNQLEDIWLRKKNSLPDGSPVSVVDQAVGSKIRDDFYEKVTHKSPTQVKAFWTRLIFTGKGSAPKTLRDDNEVKRWVSENAGGLGYIDKASLDDSVKVLLSLP